MVSNLAVEQDLVVVVGTTGKYGVVNQEPHLLLMVELVTVDQTIIGMVTLVTITILQFTSNSSII